MCLLKIKKKNKPAAGKANEKAACGSSRTRTPAWGYRKSPLNTVPFDSLAFKVKEAVAFPIPAKPSPSYTGANCVGSLRCFCRDRAPPVSSSIIRHLSNLQRIRSRKKRVREFYMPCFVQNRIRKGRARTILPVLGGKLNSFHSVQAEADVQYSCVCA